MEALYSNIIPITELGKEIEQIFTEKYKVKNSNLSKSIKTLTDWIVELKDGIYLFVEYPYVDKAYRDTYYSYFASKRDEYPRNTIRVSFFDSKIEDSHFRCADKVEELQSKYLGFLIIRPTFPFVIGRNVIAPQAFKNNNFISCKVKYRATVNSLKMDVSGFPHSSQDSETITCAETTVWSILEYFGNRYAEYKPALPSQVNSVLGKFSFERLVPSKGLTAGQISFALREYGFGVKIYSRNAYKDDFDRLLKIYVESGIPVVGVIENNQGIGHALNIIGRSNITKENVDSLKSIKSIGNNVNIFDFSDIDVDYIYIDDNYPPYRATKINTPASYYSDSRWKNCEVTNFIAPLYPKIYMEAGEARQTTISLIEQLNIIANKDILIKTFLSSSRSFKNEIALNSSLNADAKELLLSISMPKFIWVTEITDKNLILQDLVNGMIVLDATEPKRFGIIAALMENRYIAHDLISLTKIELPLEPFSNYKNNLK